jgi:hypothetical protein
MKAEIRFSGENFGVRRLVSKMNLYSEKREGLVNRVILQYDTITLTQGFEKRILTCFQENGSWKTKCFTFWKGEEGGELNFTNSQWFNTIEECEKDMILRANQMIEIGFN